MYSVEDMKTLSIAPKFDEFELSHLTTYYETYLCEKLYTYYCKDENGKEIIIPVSFNIGNFAHLSGIDKCVPKRYGAETIFNKLKHLRWDKAGIKSLDKSRVKSNFKDAKKRMRYLCIVNEILINPGVISFNTDRVVPSTHIKSTSFSD